MPSKSNGINHSALKLLIEAGAIISTTAFAEADQWMLKVGFGDSEKTILAKNSGKARIWRKIDTLAKYLAKLGITKFEINMIDYDPSQKTLTRPDSAAILKQAHKAHKSQQDQNSALEDEIMQETAQTELSPEKVKVNWEERRARILQQEDPRVK
jgi:hypothetical protein